MSGHLCIKFNLPVIRLVDRRVNVHDSAISYCYLSLLGQLQVPGAQPPPLVSHVYESQHAMHGVGCWLLVVGYWLLAVGCNISHVLFAVFRVQPTYSR